MVDEDKTVVKDKTVVEEPAEEPKTDEEPVEEPKVEEPSDAVAPAGDAVAPAGTDQQGRQLYSVKCANCGKQTEVPFKPSGDRPVYCRDCYMQKKGGRV